jgi:transcriptional regulator with XRE-family HTH domain
MDEMERQAEQVALRVRGLRRQRGWTLDASATRLGVSRRLLAQLEAGQGNPSLSTLLAIAAGFDVSLVDLLSEGDKPAVTLQADNATAPVLWEGPQGGTGRLLLGSDPLELWQWALQPGEERTSAAHRTGSREILLVTTGAVSIEVGADEPVVVRRGQSALFRADEPHTYRNHTRSAAAFLLAVHEPSGVAA